MDSRAPVVGKWSALALMACASACTPSPIAPDGGTMPVDSGPTLGAVGAACDSDLDCRSGLTCFSGAPDARPWPGGYCSRDCTEEDCPAGSTCGEAYYDASSEQHYQCLATCDREDA